MITKLALKFLQRKPFMAPYKLKRQKFVLNIQRRMKNVTAKYVE